jgi:hypothetical protein
MRYMNKAMSKAERLIEHLLLKIFGPVLNHERFRTEGRVSKKIPGLRIGRPGILPALYPSQSLPRRLVSEAYPGKVF